MTLRAQDKRRVVKEPFAPGHIDMTPTGFRRWNGAQFEIVAERKYR